MENLTWKAVTSQLLGSLSPDSPGNPKLTNSCNRPWPATVLQGPGHSPQSGVSVGRHWAASSAPSRLTPWPGSSPAQGPEGVPYGKALGRRELPSPRACLILQRGPRPGTGPCKVSLPELGSTLKGHLAPHGIWRPLL